MRAFALSILLTTSVAVAQSTVPLVSSRDGRLLGSDSAMFDGFGAAVALDGQTAVVGSSGAPGAAGAEVGAAYVYVRTAAGWLQEAKLVASDGAAGDRFGNSVAIDGDRVAVGAFLADPTAPDSGAVYVFEKSGAAWSQVAKLTGIGADISEGLGWSLALQGDTLVAGAADDHHSGGQFDGGAAYVFVRSGGVWTQQQRVIAGDGEAFDYFGHAVALAGDRLVVGAYSDNHANAANGGSAYVFQRAASVWTLAQKIVPADNHSNDLFGFALALQGDTLIATAAGDSLPGILEAGSAYVFQHGPGGFSETQKLLAPAPQASAGFGASTALAGDALIVGASAANSSAARFTGAAYVYQLTSSGFVPQLALRATQLQPGAAFGYAVAIDDALALVGAPFDDASASAQHVGVVYAYVVEPAVQAYCTAKVNGLGCTPSIDWSGTPSLSSAAPFVIGASDVFNRKPGLLMFGYAAAAAPFDGGTLCIAGAIRRTPAQDSGGSASGDDCSGAYAFDFNAWMQSGATPELQAGSQVYAQYWSRDPSSAPPVGLTDALHFHVQP